MTTHPLTIPPETLLARIAQLENDRNARITVHMISKTGPHFFFTANNSIDLGLSPDYRTGIHLVLSINDGAAACQTRKQAPPYLPVLAMIIIGYGIFDATLMHASNTVTTLAPLLLLLVILLLVHVLNISTISTELGNLLSTDDPSISTDAQP